MPAPAASASTAISNNKINEILFLGRMLLVSFFVIPDKLSLFVTTGIDTFTEYQLLLSGFLSASGPDLL